MADVSLTSPIMTIIYISYILFKTKARQLPGFLLISCFAFSLIHRITNALFHFILVSAIAQTRTSGSTVLGPLHLS